MSETDFYVYRYLGNEGFLPGYNFPRLPVRALVATGNEAHSIDRARSSVWSSLVPAIFFITKDASIGSLRSSCLLEALRLA
jgi:hypothetical protein